MMDLDRFLAEAKAKVRQKAQAEARRIGASKKHRADLIAENRKRKWREAQKKRKRAGLEVAQSFLQEIAGPFMRMMARDDAATMLNGMRIILRPYKGDHGPFSFHIDNNGKTINYPNGSVRELANKQGWENDRLVQKLSSDDDGFECSSMAEMLEEILRLRSINRMSQARIKELEEAQSPSSDADTESEATDGIPTDTDETSEG
jgi:hypothetical protein